MDEARWYNSAEEYRAIQGLARDGHYAIALERGERALATVPMGRRSAARLHSLACWLHTEPLGRPGPRAVLHGEEAVQLAELIHDCWIKCEALSRLILALVQLGQAERAADYCQVVAAEVQHNAGALTGGVAGLNLLQAYIAHAQGATARALVLSGAAERPGDPAVALVLGRARNLRLYLLLSSGQLSQAEELLAVGQPDYDPCCLLEWDMLRAWALALRGRAKEAEGLLAQLHLRADQLGNASIGARCQAIAALVAQGRGDEMGARHLAHQALHRAIGAGQTMWVRQLRVQLAHLI